VPGILCGAAYGRLVGVFVADMHPRQTIDEVRVGCRVARRGLGLGGRGSAPWRRILPTPLRLFCPRQSGRPPKPHRTRLPTARPQGTYALLGAASFLGGSMRLTVCTCVMLLELTNNLNMLPLVMLVLLIAKVGGGAQLAVQLGAVKYKLMGQRQEGAGAPGPAAAAAHRP
jgi:hypothetical protein